jgi:hypothetical protein
LSWKAVRLTILSSKPLLSSLVVREDPSNLWRMETITCETGASLGTTRLNGKSMSGALTLMDSSS